MLRVLPLPQQRVRGTPGRGEITRKGGGSYLPSLKKPFRFLSPLMGFLPDQFTPCKIDRPCPAPDARPITPL